ncbi:hypothetical protein DAMA08_017050 [Martiniozyma asiatica (nom. inval.)]|nr:hypothetical protein DAMA08_017050 [Martiniozyma asiatica]
MRRNRFSELLKPFRVLKRGAINSSLGGNRFYSANNKEFDPKQLNRKANLGTMIQLVQVGVPKLLSELLPHQLVSESIILRILPSQFNLPIMNGYLMYSTTFKVLQKSITMFYLNPSTQIHITNIQIEEPTGSLSSEELLNLSIDNNSIEYGDSGSNSNSNDSFVTPHSGFNNANLNKQTLSKYTTKIKIKWKTCNAGCPHLMDADTTDAKLGTYSTDRWLGILKNANPIQQLALNEAKKRIEELTGKLDVVNSKGKVEKKEARILTGLFIFELNHENDQIMVFTIDNVEILESNELEMDGGCFA